MSIPATIIEKQLHDILTTQPLNQPPCDALAEEITIRFDDNIQTPDLINPDDSTTSYHELPYEWLDLYGQDELCRIFVTELPLAAAAKNEFFLIKKMTTIMQNPQTIFEWVNEYNQTILHIAIKAEATIVLGWLLDLNPGNLILNRKDTEGNTALDTAALLGQLAHVMLLILNGATFTPELFHSLNQLILVNVNKLVSLSNIVSKIHEAKTTYVEKTETLKHTDWIINHYMRIINSPDSTPDDIAQYTQILNEKLFWPNKEMMICHHRLDCLYKTRDYLINQLNALRFFDTSLLVSGNNRRVFANVYDKFIPPKQFKNLLHLNDIAYGGAQQGILPSILGLSRSRAACHSLAYQLKYALEIPRLKPWNEMTLKPIIAIYHQINMVDVNQDPAIAAENLMVLLFMLFINPSKENYTLLLSITNSTNDVPYYSVLESYREICKNLILLLKTQSIYLKNAIKFNSENPNDTPMKKYLMVLSIQEIHDLPESGESKCSREKLMAQQALTEAQQWFDTYHVSLLDAINSNIKDYCEEARIQAGKQAYHTHGLPTLQSLCERTLRLHSTKASANRFHFFGRTFEISAAGKPIWESTMNDLSCPPTRLPTCSSSLS